MLLERKVSKICCYFAVKEHCVHPDAPLGHCAYKVLCYSSAILVFIEKQVSCTKMPVIHSSLPNISLNW